MILRLFLVLGAFALAGCEVSATSPTRESPRATETNVARGPDCPDAAADADIDAGLFCRPNQDGLYPPCKTDADCKAGTCSHAGFCTQH